MPLLVPESLKIYLCLSAVDMRKSIQGLSLLVSESLEMDPCSGCMYLFRNKQRNKLKALYFERHCFNLWYRRLDKGHFTFPKLHEGHISITGEQFNWLLESFDCSNMGSVTQANYQSFC